jgi:hypothetical protein
MSIPILLNSSNYNAANGKLVYQFPRSQILSSKEVALTAASFYNSFFNISAANVNNTITFNFPAFTAANTYTMVPYTMTFDDGFYSFNDINSAIQNFCIGQNLYLYDPSSAKNVYFVAVSVNSVQYKCSLSVALIPTNTQRTTLGWTIPGVPSGGAIVNPTTGNIAVSPTITVPTGLASLLGISPGTYPSVPVTSTAATYTANPTVTLGSSAPAINPVNAVIVRCNLVNNSNFGYPVDMIAQIPMTAAYGAVNQYSAPAPTFTPVGNSAYQSIELSFANDDLSPLFFFDKDLSFTLELRNVKN